MRLVLTLILVVLAALPPLTSAQAPPIKVGFASAMSGPAAITGEGVRWGGTLAVEEINAKGGVAGRKIEAYFADNKATPGEAVSAVRKLADVDKVDVIIGQTHSGACLGAMPVVKEIGVPMVIESCSHADIRKLSGKGGNEWTFRVALDDEIMAHTFARHMAAKGVKTSSILAMNNDFGRGAAAAYDAAFKKANIKLASTEFFDPGQPDYRPVLTRLKRAGAETILGIILASDGAPFMRQFRELGLTQKVYSRGSLASAEFLHQVKDNPKVGDGVVEAGYWVAGLDPEWDRKWEERHKVPPRIHGSLAAITFKHAVVPALEIAIKKGKVDRAGIRAALTEVDVKDSPLGPIKFDANHQAWINMILLEMQDGKIRILEKLPTSPALLN
ncbi:MAG: ABC transporter substrate-binding protein [Candidatus Rokubacteria bacterium]|nr:ABC transporter substrate-binding protein [Candidatus Rokubacteria bacterium]